MAFPISHGSVRAEQFSELLGNPRVRPFAERMLTASYVECVPGHEEAMREIMARSFDLLTAARGDDRQFRTAAATVVGDLFHKSDPDFWFNRVYKHYKRAIKPERRLAILRGLLRGERVLDLGCGDGLTSLALSRHGYQVLLTDVLDYRDETARALPFAAMADPAAIPYPDQSADSAIVMAVLHHVEPEQLMTLLGELRRVCRRVVVEEDCYGVPADLPGLADVLEQDAFLREFVDLAPEDQLRFLMFVDYFANVIAQGLGQMDMPFGFRTVPEWWVGFAACGFRVEQTLLLGFQRGNFNRSCHVWFVLD